jgi:hypothetical protein
MTSDHGRWVDVDRRHRADHSTLTGEVRPDSGSEVRLTRAGHGLPEFSSARSNSGVVGSHGGRTLPKEGLVWSATWGMSAQMMNILYSSLDDHWGSHQVLPDKNDSGGGVFHQIVNVNRLVMLAARR